MNPDYSNQERRLAASPLPNLPQPTGKVRFQELLDQDERYRELILTAFGLAVLMASGFGQAAGSMGPAAAGLMSVGFSGVALRSVVPRAGTASPSAKLAALVLLGFTAVACLLAGQDGLYAVIGAVGILGLSVLSSTSTYLRVASSVMGAVGLIAWAGFAASLSGDHEHLLLIIVSAGIAAPFSLWTYFSAGNIAEDMKPAVQFSSLCTYAWGAWMLSQRLQGLMLVSATAASFLLYATLERLITRRQSFAPVVVALIAIDLSGFLTKVNNQPRMIPVELAVLLLQFGLLGAAGYRLMAAGLAKLPQSTYRVSPQYPVSSMEQAWDHPLRIDAS